MHIHMGYTQNAAILHALGHPIRYCIVEGLVEAERDVSNMASCLDEPQPKVSQHLNVLKAAGVIEGRRDGTRMVYGIKSDKVRRIVRALRPAGINAHQNPVFFE